VRDGRAAVGIVERDQERNTFDAAFARGGGLGRDGALALLEAELDAVEAELGDG
jgi:hypothetical protein